jgi:3-methyladenine DNA glycosylase AlkD
VSAAPANPSPAVLLARVRDALAAAGDPARAAGQQAYMKSVIPYHGVMTGPQRTIFLDVFADFAHASVDEWREAVLYLWRNAEYREERYAAIWLSGDLDATDFHTIAVLPMYEEMIVTGAWWDYVDEIATHRLPAILLRDRARMADAMLAWSRGENVWKRRASILCQLPLKAKTDMALLQACIAPSIGSREFFLRKAIGWALRQYARTDAAWVERYVRDHAAELSPLSKREALKAQLRSGAIAAVP